MSNLSKSILNYFATFTETRFNFRTRINYHWTNDELTLDLSLFSDLQKTVLEGIKSGKLQKISIKKGQFTISIPSEKIYSRINEQLSNKFNLKYLQNCISQTKEKSATRTEKLIISEDGIVKESSDELDSKEKTKIDFLEGVRIYNLAFRKILGEILIGVQEDKLNQIKEDLQIEFLPPTIFNYHDYIQKCFDLLQEIARRTDNANDFYDEIQRYFKTETKEIVIYDLFFNLQKYIAFANVGTLYLFVNELYKEIDDKENVSYPLYFIEIEINSTPTEVIVSIPRKLLLINSTAINYFQFPSVLTTPRAVDINSAYQQLLRLEVFLQAQYGYKDPFITESIFRPITPIKEDYPT
ncbi:MAG: hypothetical protein PHS44_08190, partial [Candidatus Dojkabacteria bacterium]|nr:hypothetical protein [Candidatus Dojkabacteria bacterium]